MKSKVTSAPLSGLITSLSDHCYKMNKAPFTEAPYFFRHSGNVRKIDQIKTRSFFECSHEVNHLPDILIRNFPFILRHFTAAELSLVEKFSVGLFLELS